MVRRHFRPGLLLLVALSLGANVARAATVAPPAHLGELARLSTAVVLAEARASADLTSATVASPLPYTVTRFHTVEWVGGARVGEEFEVVEPGGTVEGKVAVVGGAPRYEAGRTYLLFLDLRDDGYWRSRMLAYGLLVADAATGLLEPLPEAGWIEPLSGAPFESVEAYERGALLGHLRAVLSGQPWNRERAGAVPALPSAATSSLVPQGCAYLAWDGDGLPFRWFDWERGAGPARIRPTTPGQSGIGDGGVSAVQQGAQAWQAHGDSLIRTQTLSVAPREVSCTGGELDVQQGAVWFNDPCGDIPPLNGCAGTLAFGGGFFNTSTRSYDGALWHPAVPNTSYVVVNNGAQCIGEVSFREMMTHEIGHTLGFGHHAASPPPNPTMSSSLKGDGRGASLVGRDRSCASFAYHTFLDIPYEHGLWPYVEAIENRGVTGGCAAGFYCPGASTTRGQMAAFLLRAKHGAAYDPPPCTAPGPFGDVPCSHPFAAWIEELVERGVTSGCGGEDYCPGGVVTRAQMAVFLLRTLEGSGYTPPACTTDPFDDVAAGSPFCRWIRELVNRGITSGCGGGNYCPGAAATRGQMAVFLTETFGLTLPG